MSWENINHALRELHLVLLNLGGLVFSAMFIGDVLWRKWADFRKHNRRKVKKQSASATLPSSK